MLVLLARLSPGIPPSVSVSTQGSFGTSIIRQKVDNSPVTQKGEEKQGNRLSEAEQKYTTGEQERLAEEVNIAKEDLRLENGAYLKGAALAVPNMATVRAGVLQEGGEVPCNPQKKKVQHSWALTDYALHDIF